MLPFPPNRRLPAAFACQPAARPPGTRRPFFLVFTCKKPGRGTRTINEVQVAYKWHLRPIVDARLGGAWRRREFGADCVRGIVARAVGRFTRDSLQC